MRNKIFITKSALILVKWNVEFNGIVICVIALQGIKNCEINGLRLHNFIDDSVGMQYYVQHDYQTCAFLARNMSMTNGLMIKGRYHVP